MKKFLKYSVITLVTGVIIFVVAGVVGWNIGVYQSLNQKGPLFRASSYKTDLVEFHVADEKMLIPRNHFIGNPTKKIIEDGDSLFWFHWPTFVGQTKELMIEVRNSEKGISSGLDVDIDDPKKVKSIDSWGSYLKERNAPFIEEQKHGLNCLVPMKVPTSFLEDVKEICSPLKDDGMKTLIVCAADFEGKDRMCRHYVELKKIRFSTRYSKKKLLQNWQKIESGIIKKIEEFKRAYQQQKNTGA